MAIAMRAFKALPTSAKPKAMGARKPSSVICRVASGRSSEVYECELLHYMAVQRQRACLPEACGDSFHVH